MFGKRKNERFDWKREKNTFKSLFSFPPKIEGI